MFQLGHFQDAKSCSIMFLIKLTANDTNLDLKVVEERLTLNGEVLSVDMTKPNPNGIEFDNLYLDMNGIIHPCCHPQDKPAPKSEEEMFLAIFAYIDHIMRLIRPRKLLYMAIDGVAPRAKMNQQRSRRFRAIQDAEAEAERRREEDANAPKETEILASDAGEPEEHWDSNCITPGTPFMANLVVALRYFVAHRLSTNPGWQHIKVLLSDASVPGEGEHKVMDFVRRQRCEPGYDPNTKHVLYGLDADLIMLGIATHEPHFSILREDLLKIEDTWPKNPNVCRHCYQYGHRTTRCPNPPAEGRLDSTPFLFLHMPVLREYLEAELYFTEETAGFSFNLERALDDWVFLCFFVGNDFLPHLPSMRIKEGAVDLLVDMWKANLRAMGGYLTEHGHVHLDRLQPFIDELGRSEAHIFTHRFGVQLGHRRTRKRRRFIVREQRRLYRQQLGHKVSDRPPILAVNDLDVDGDELSSEMSDSDEEVAQRPDRTTYGKQRDQTLFLTEWVIDTSVKMHSGSWRTSYYETKFQDTSEAFRTKVGQAYVEGLCWVLHYYYLGCASWTWFYPYHYAPLAQDMRDLASMSVQFELGAPFMPVEQLMGVFPAASRMHIPAVFHDLMTSPDSPIIDFYPTKFKNDLNGETALWKAVSLLPFIDEARLRAAMKGPLANMSAADRKLNARGHEILMVAQDHELFTTLAAVYQGDGREIALDMNLGRLGGTIRADSRVCEPGATMMSPFPDHAPDVVGVTCLSAAFAHPAHKITDFKRGLLEGVHIPRRILKWNDITYAYSKSRQRAPHPLVKEYGGQDKLPDRPPGILGNRTSIFGQRDKQQQQPLGYGQPAQQKPQHKHQQQQQKQQRHQHRQQQHNQHLHLHQHHHHQQQHYEQQRQRQQQMGLQTQPYDRDHQKYGTPASDVATAPYRPEPVASAPSGYPTPVAPAVTAPSAYAVPIALAVSAPSTFTVPTTPSSFPTAPRTYAAPAAVSSFSNNLQPAGVDPVSIDVNLSDLEQQQQMIEQQIRSLKRKQIELQLAKLKKQQSELEQQLQSMGDAGSVAALAVLPQQPTPAATAPAVPQPFAAPIPALAASQPSPGAPAAPLASPTKRDGAPVALPKPAKRSKKMKKAAANAVQPPVVEVECPAEFVLPSLTLNSAPPVTDDLAALAQRHLANHLAKHGGGVAVHGNAIMVPTASHRSLLAPGGNGTA
ncbi:5'-3' exoribonuclease 2 [Allomyces arbusculus]|nr:5'-3' exoribonuclease 2 [Allomyces arbusculus]